MQAMRDTFSLAWSDLEKALALRPKLVHARLLRVRVLTAEADHAEMRAEVDRATKVCPGCFRIRVVYLLNTTPRWGGTYPAMLAFASTCDPAVNVRCRALPGFVDDDKGDLAWTNSRLPDAEAALDRALAFGDCASFFLERAQIRRVRQNFAGALADADRALALWHAPVVLVERSEALYALKRWEEAARTLLEALRIEPTESRGKAVAHDVALGVAFEGWTEAQAGNLDHGLDLFDLAREIAPLDREIEGRRAQVLAGDGEKGLPALERAVVGHPDDLRLHQRLDYALSVKAEFPRILDMWTTYIARHPDDARAYMERAGTNHQLGHDVEARADARKACELGITEGCMRSGR
jgi:tetratricopeptide (TPR) repeat protein